ncbi:hypothetical protein SLE2022_405910 [Rubroshorea leprosula]
MGGDGLHARLRHRAARLRPARRSLGAAAGAARHARRLRGREPVRGQRRHLPRAARRARPPGADVRLDARAVGGDRARSLRLAADGADHVGRADDLLRRADPGALARPAPPRRRAVALRLLRARLVRGRRRRLGGAAPARDAACGLSGAARIAARDVPPDPRQPLLRGLRGGGVAHLRRDRRLRVDRAADLRRRVPRRAALHAAVRGVRLHDGLRLVRQQPPRRASGHARDLADGARRANRAVGAAPCRHRRRTRGAADLPRLPGAEHGLHRPVRRQFRRDGDGAGRPRGGHRLLDPGCITSVGAVAIASVIGQSYDGTTRPLAIGYLCIGLAALGVVAWIEGGRLFRPHVVPAPRG